MPAVSGKVQLRAGFGRLKSLSMTCAGCGFEIQADFAFFSTSSKIACETWSRGPTESVNSSRSPLISTAP